MSVPNHRERQLMQELRGAGWVRAIALDEQLLALLESKIDRPSIARKLKRTVAAITIRLMVLRGKTK
jgi:hypothetical protein